MNVLMPCLIIVLKHTFWKTICPMNLIVAHFFEKHINELSELLQKSIDKHEGIKFNII